MRRSRSGRPKVSRTLIAETVSRMSQPSDENGEEAIDEAGRNATQQRMDEEGTEPVPVDEDWGDEQGARSSPKTRIAATAAPSAAPSRATTTPATTRQAGPARTTVVPARRT